MIILVINDYIVLLFRLRLIVALLYCYIVPLRLLLRLRLIVLLLHCFAFGLM